jgi:5,10-methenyltetrahydromethanopterin hydrogenase
MLESIGEIVSGAALQGGPAFFLPSLEQVFDRKAENLPNPQDAHIVLMHGLDPANELR